MKGLTLTTKDLQSSHNPLWRQAAGGTDRKPRKKRFEGPTSESKAWVREMDKGEGVFFQTGRIINWLNWRGHWRVKQKAVALQRVAGFMQGRCAMAKAGLLGYSIEEQGEWVIDPPFLVKLCRYGPKKLDDGEAVAASLKGYRDGIAQALGVDDGDTDSVKFTYEQNIAKWHGLRIELEAA